MKTFYFLLVIIFSLLSMKSQAQNYELISAFPNLPAFSTPVSMVESNDSTNRLFVAQLKGIIYVFDNTPTVSTRKVFINLNSKIAQTSPEAGLLGITFHPNYKNNHYFYVHYVFDSTGGSGQWVRISRFTASETNPDSAILNSEQRLLTISLPDRGHNGGQVQFGPDKYLYISLGDGYSGGDISQDKTYLLGKILRINVDTTSNGRNYGIPPDNPYAVNPYGWRQEIYAIGFRNPFRFNFDFPTNRLWVSDVGQNTFEEIDLVENGKNYGWNKMEGFHCYPDTTICDTTGRGFTRPVWEYKHIPFNIGFAVLAGYTYRGPSLTELTGKFIYGDNPQGRIWSLEYDGVNPTVNTLLLDTTFKFSSFSTDQNNEVYVLRINSTNDGIYKLHKVLPITVNLKAIIEGYYNLSLDALNRRDTVKVFLCSTTNPITINDSAVTVLDSLSFSGLCTFNNASPGSYYIIVKHRNSLETWSESQVTLTRDSATLVDFTCDTTKVFGSNTKLKGTRYCIISGDCNQSGVINAIDRAVVIGELGLDGYLSGDLDGNGVVNAADRAIVVGNLGRSKITP